ncbi:MAG: response regulator transcription factor [Roseiflexaceae bacterium]
MTTSVILNKRILVVEDRLSVRTMIADYLSQHQYAVSVASNGHEALLLCQQQEFDCVILDLMMPVMDGTEFLRRLRMISMVPVLVISAKLEERDKIEALELGADEYVNKPISLREILARLQALIRRATLTQPQVGTPQSVQLDSVTRNALVRRIPVELTSTEYRILELLLTDPGRVFSRTNFAQHLYGKEDHKIARSIDMHIRNLRSKIEPHPDNPIYIITVYGAGYRIQI